MKKIIFFVFIVSSIVFSGCDEEIPYEYEDDGPKPKNQSDFYGTWDNRNTYGTTADISLNNFGFINKGRIPNIIFEMSINSWEKVPCEVTFYEEDSYGNLRPAKDFSEQWRIGKTTYKITGTVIQNTKPDSVIVGVGLNQSIFLHHSGYNSIYIGATKTDAESPNYFRK